MSADGSDISWPARGSPPPGAFPSSPTSPVITAQTSLNQALYDRRHEYTTTRRVRIKVGTWNVAAKAGTEKDVAAWFVKGKGVSESLAGLESSAGPREEAQGPDRTKETRESVGEQEERCTTEESTLPLRDPGSLPGDDEIGLYVLGLQEIVDISSVTGAFRPYHDYGPATKWKEAISDGLPLDYKLVAEQQLSGLYLLIYASPTIAPTISSVSTRSVGTGLGGYMGNKGGVSARIVLGEMTRMVFVNCHLAAGNEKGSLERRNWDASQITSRTRFDPIDRGYGVGDEPGASIGEEDFSFWFGDLNYRLAGLPGDDVRRLLMLHTKNEYDTASAATTKIEHEVDPKAQKEEDHQGHDERTEQTHRVDAGTVSAPPLRTLHDGEGPDPDNDPTSLQTTLSSLLPHDQLHEQIRSRKAFHEGWHEGPIRFLPTYKYDVGSVGVFDSSEKKRGPSWCDRILYRTRKDFHDYQRRAEESQQAKKIDEELKARGLDKRTDSTGFDYDPETDGAENGYEEADDGDRGSEVITTKSGCEGKLDIEYYTSHQRVLSSDHKPLDAVFSLIYEAVDPKLKAEIRQEVARELDRAENESRPLITVVPDNTDGKSSSEMIDFGDIRYDHERSHTITIASIGRVPATFGFERNEGAGSSHGWLHVKSDREPAQAKPASGLLEEHTLEPGDILNTVITIWVKDIDDVRALNSGKQQLEDVLILKVRGGSDHFLTVRGTWLQSSFGHSLDTLVRVPEEGVRSRVGSQRLAEEGVKWSAPRELFRLTETLEENLERAVAEWGMKDGEATPPWHSAGWPFASDTWTYRAKGRDGAKYDVREALDRGRKLTFAPDLELSDRVEVLAETLLSFLDSIENGVIGDEIWSRLAEAIGERERAKKLVSSEQERNQILDIISAAPAQSISFTSVVFMLARVTSEVAPLHSVPTVGPPRSPTGAGQDASLRRKDVERRYADVFARVLFRTKSEGKGKEKRVNDERKRHTISVFLERKEEEQ